MRLGGLAHATIQQMPGRSGEASTYEGLGQPEGAAATMPLLDGASASMRMRVIKSCIGANQIPIRRHLVQLSMPLGRTRNQHASSCYSLVMELFNIVIAIFRDMVTDNAAQSTSKVIRSVGAAFWCRTFHRVS